MYMTFIISVATICVIHFFLQCTRMHCESILAVTSIPSVCNSTSTRLRMVLLKMSSGTADNNAPGSPAMHDDQSDTANLAMQTPESRPEEEHALAAHEPHDTQNSTDSSSESSAIDAISETSTIRYEQKPFTDFRVQVEQLCQSLWPPSSRDHRIPRFLGGHNKRFFGALRSRKVGRLLGLASPPKAYDIERMKGGGFNRVVGVKVVRSDDEEPIPLVLRTARYLWNSRPDREIAALEYVRQHTAIPIPHVKAFDLTDENPLKMPYILLERIAGVGLNTMMSDPDNMSHKQWCTLAKDLGHLILELQKIEHPTPGLIETILKEEAVQSFHIRPFDIRRPRNINWKQEQANSPTREADNEIALQWYKDTFNFFAAQFGRAKMPDRYCVEPADATTCLCRASYEISKHLQQRRKPSSSYGSCAPEHHGRDWPR